MIRGKVGIQDLKVPCFVGVYPHEKVTRQDLFVDLVIEADLTKSIQSDSLEDAYDYDKLAELCLNVANQKHYHLIEVLAEAILSKIFKQFSVGKAWICIKKTQGLPMAKYSFVELEKTQ